MSCLKEPAPAAVMTPLSSSVVENVGHEFILAPTGVRRSSIEGPSYTSQASPPPPPMASSDDDRKEDLHPIRTSTPATATVELQRRRAWGPTTKDAPAAAERVGVVDGDGDGSRGGSPFGNGCGEGTSAQSTSSCSGHRHHTPIEVRILDGAAATARASRLASLPPRAVAGPCGTSPTILRNDRGDPLPHPTRSHFVSETMHVLRSRAGYSSTSLCKDPADFAASCRVVLPSSSSNHAATAPSPPPTSLTAFAPFFEVAIQEIIGDCERRVANAPVTYQEQQKANLRGRNNHQLGVSTHSFDSPAASISQVSSPGLYCDPHSPWIAHGRTVTGDQRCASTHSRGCSMDVAAMTSSSGQLPAPTETVHSLLDHIDRSLRYGEAAPMVFIGALAYLSRVAMRCTTEFLSVTHSNWYRLTTIAVLVASKMYNERGAHHLNGCVSRCSGMPLREINKMELDFLYLIDLDLLLVERDVEGWVAWMEALAIRQDMVTPVQHLLLPSAQDPSASVAGEDSATTSVFENGAVDVKEARPASSIASMRVVAHNHNPANHYHKGGVHHRTASAVSSSFLMGAPAGRSEVESDLQSSLLQLMRYSSSRLSGAGTTMGFGHREVPPSPISGIADHHWSRAGRLFSVVHGVADPPTPITIRQLIQRGPSPTSPRGLSLPGPSSPASFFRPHHHTRNPSQVASANSGARATGSDMRTSMAMLPPPAACRPLASVATAPPAAKPAPAVSSSSRWGPPGVMHRVRDVLGLTASLMRGQLNVLAGGSPGAATATVEDDDEVDLEEEELAMTMTPSPNHHTTATAATELAGPPVLPRPPLATSSDGVSLPPWAPSLTPPEPADPRPRQPAEPEWEEDYDDEEGYYDEDDYYYDEEYGYDEEEEEERRAPPPMTHSPPSL